jgi:hypothetical protein
MNMAAAWTDLAQRAEKNLPNDILHEPKPSFSVVLQQQRPQRKTDEEWRITQRPSRASHPN